MDRYDYVVLTKEDCMEGETTGQLVNGRQFSSDVMNARLTEYGEEGYRVIMKVENSPGDWLLILSRIKLNRSR